MVYRPKLSLRFLDHCLTDAAGLTQLRQALEKIDKCRQAVARQMNLADVLTDPANVQAFGILFGEEYDVGLQLCLRFGLENYEAVSFTLTQGIEGRKKIDFIHRSVGGWQQFDAVISLHLPETDPGNSMILVNPRRAEHWAEIDAIPAGTVVTVYLRNPRVVQGGSAEEKLALTRYQAVFDTVQHISDAAETEPMPAVQFERPSAPAPRATAPAPSAPSASRNGTNGSGSHAPGTNGAGKVRRKPVAPTVTSRIKSVTAPQGAPKGAPSFSFKVQINKMDTFVHAGNAQLIVSHVKDYPGRITMSVIRAEKKGVSLDSDSIWSAEIRNGETVLYEFYGPVPDDGFVKELAKKTNKYTQMDKLTG